MRIQKYQSPANGIIQQDNTHVAKPIEQTFIKRTPRQAYLSQDNRTQLQHEEGRKKADEAYNQQIKDKNTAEALNHLIGFSNFADIVGLGVGMGSLAKYGVKRGIKSAAESKLKNATKNLHQAKIGDILQGSGILPHKSYSLPDYANPNSPMILATDYHKMRLSRGFKDIPGIDAKGSDNFKGIPYKSKDVNIEHFDINDDVGNYIEQLYNYYKDKFPAMQDEIIHDVIRKVIKTNHAFAPAVHGKVFTNKKFLDSYFGEGKFPGIVSHEIEHAVHIPIRPAEGFDTNLLRTIAPDDPEYFIRNNNSDLAARFSQLKDYYGLTRPDQEITEDMLRYAAEHYVKDTGLDNNMTDFFKAIKDWKKAAKWGSEMATAYTGVTMLNNKQK